jgi:hypothetical protein
MVPFLDVTATNAHAPAVAVEIALANGRVVRVLAAFDDAVLARALAIADRAAA